MFIKVLHKLAASSCLVAGISLVGSVLPQTSFAQTNAGFILWGNTKDNALDYCLDQGSADRYDRYYLEVKSQKFKVSEVILTYPEHYTGVFDQSGIELRLSSDCRSGKSIPLESATWDKENRRIVVVPKEAVPANTPMRLVLSNVRNPYFGGMFQLDARVMRADVPVPVYVGSWIIGID
ncbi:DUF2808 domain-containing protein [Tumidithrix elongata RA019]|uniref:DUF2808 domain-containing protein n=1 Tax=Tumidithrix elongata BACA0141 TaxID=2716417 RepID=A0AAW9PRB3_9CYAN|nr:DUF2808 domain-containing protein [Tumidithrix elongata RA019]